MSIYCDVTDVGSISKAVVSSFITDFGFSQKSIIYRRGLLGGVLMQI